MLKSLDKSDKEHSGQFSVVILETQIFTTNKPMGNRNINMTLNQISLCLIRIYGRNHAFRLIQ